MDLGNKEYPQVEPRSFNMHDIYTGRTKERPLGHKSAVLEMQRD